MITVALLNECLEFLLRGYLGFLRVLIELANLAETYLTGDVLPKDVPTRMKYLREAAQRGNAWAQRVLGHRYQDGEGVEQNDAAGFDWLFKAALSGDVKAKDDVYYAYRSGRGVKKDP